MFVDAMLATKDFSLSTASAAEEAGYRTLWAGETDRDPFLVALLAAQATGHARIGTNIAVAFARSPMTVASTAYDLAAYSRGRFILGLGSQVKPHIERRFSMPWSHPAPRMREFVLAIRAIWASWQTGDRLDFRGDFYQHTLMTPLFVPDLHEEGPPPVYLAGVGPHMTEVAGEVAEGYLWHPFTTQRYLREVTIPALERGRSRATDAAIAGDLDLTGQVFVIMGRDDAEMRSATEAVKNRIAFYASTPAYRAVLDLHGMGDLQPELTALSRTGRWAEMASLIPDELVDAVAVAGTPEDAGRALRDRWADLASAVSLYAPYDIDPGVWPVVLQAARDGR